MPSHHRPAAGGLQGPRAGAAVLRRYGQTLEVSRDGREPLAPALLRPLLPQLEYDHTTLLYGADAVDPLTGDRRSVQVERMRLYEFDARGRLVTGAGFTDRIYAHLRAAGCVVDWVDRDPPPARPERFVPRWERLERHHEFHCTAQDRADFARRAASVDGAAGDPEDAAWVALARRVVQREVLDVIVRRVQKGLGCTIQAVPGFGKSYLLAALGRILPRAVIAITAPDIDNCQKTHAHLSAYLSGVGFVGAGRHTGGRVTVYTAGSLHHLRERPDTDLVVVDEAHRYAAARTSAVLATVAPFAPRVQLTATPVGRLDGADPKLEWLGGPVAYQLGWPEAVALGLVVPIEVCWLSMESDDNPAAGHQGVYRKKFGIWRNAFRNARFAAAARRRPADEQTLVLVATIEHAVHLGRLLPGFMLVYGTHDVDQFRRYAADDLLADDFVPVVGPRREQLRRDFEAGVLRKAIATDVWAQGVSFDRLPYLFRADARGSTILDEQIPGRAARVHAASGKLCGRVCDSLDQFDRGFARAARGRWQNYEAKGWAQTIVGGRAAR